MKVFVNEWEWKYKKIVEIIKNLLDTYENLFICTEEDKEEAEEYVYRIATACQCLAMIKAVGVTKLDLEDEKKFSDNLRMNIIIQAMDLTEKSEKRIAKKRKNMEEEAEEVLRS